MKGFIYVKRLWHVLYNIYTSYSIVPSFDLRYDGCGSGGEAILHAMRRLLGFKL